MTPNPSDNSAIQLLFQQRRLPCHFCRRLIFVLFKEQMCCNSSCFPAALTTWITKLFSIFAMKYECCFLVSIPGSWNKAYLKVTRGVPQVSQFCKRCFASISNLLKFSLHRVSPSKLRGLPWQGQFTGICSLMFRQRGSIELDFMHDEFSPEVIQTISFLL